MEPVLRKAYAVLSAAVKSGRIQDQKIIDLLTVLECLYDVRTGEDIFGQKVARGINEFTQKTST